MTDTNTDFSVDASDDSNLDDFSADFFSADKAPVKADTEESDNGNATSHETDEADIEDEGTETNEADEGDEGDETDETRPVKKKSRFQERIDDLTSKLREQERLAKAADERLAAAIAKLESTATKAEDTQNTNTPKIEGLIEPTADDTLEDGSPKYPLGEFDPKLLRDLTRFDRAVERAHEEKVNAQTKAEQAQAEKFNTLQVEWNGKVESAKEVYPDYVEKGQDLLNSLQDIPQDYAVYLTTSLMNMDYGPDVFYYLAEHPEEARDIVNSSPEKALTRLGRIEARFETAAQERSGKETKLRNTNAPPPAPRNKGSNAQAPSVNLADASLDDFEREFFRKK